MRKYISWITAILIILSGILIYAEKRALQLDLVYPPTPEVNASSTPISGDLSTLLDRLAWCESRNTDSVKVVDTNGYYSYGRYQYQLHTWNYYIDKYDLLPHAEEHEYKNFIFDGDFQREVTQTILENEGDLTPQAAVERILSIADGTT